MAHTTRHAARRRHKLLQLSTLLGSTCAALPAQAQSEAATQQVTVSASKLTAGITGFGNLPLSSVPMQAGVTTAEQMKDLGIRRLSDIATIDAAVGDGYNADGYYDFLTVRGFVLDNRFNYRRDGLPISAETSIPLDNKSRIEVLKGTSGMLAGIGSPGGMVNFVVKRPTSAAIREAFVGWQQDGSVLGSVDLSDRFGEQRELGLRLNAAYEHIDPQTYVAEGSRYLLALAGDWRVTADTLLEAEVEVSHREQPSVPGFSVLGMVVPEPGNPRINLNNQPWSQPAKFDATTASLRWRQRLDERWSVLAQAATQQLKTDDDTAFPYGCSAEGRYDRYCSDGTYDMYDFRSDNERRRNNVVDLSLNGALLTGDVRHALTVGLQYNEVSNRFQNQAFNYAGTGNVQGTLIVPPAPDLTGTNTNRNARSTEAYLRDAIAFDEQTLLWLGLRYTHQSVDTVRTDGTGAASYSQSYAAPWLALSHKLSGGTLLYASWGTGYEPDLAPNNPRYINRGELLSALRSQQFEIGAKGALDNGDWTVAAFDIDRPVSAARGSCDIDDSCTWQRDGSVVHRGVEAGINARFGAWRIGGGAMALHAQRQDSADVSLNGLRPTNVPAYTLKLQVGYRVASVPGLDLLANGLYESDRIVLPDNSLRIPSVARLDLGLRYVQPLANGTLTWRAGVENVTNDKAWRESPYQFDHSYLFPMAPRTFAVSLQATL
ncbi:MAG TPA: TonB-dependent siderophore receptor [Rubrivivax sp.]|nr:TonB-dependent siderophore receptor [Rubrivivax sp.]